jgi:hypothetical protein
MFKYLMVLALAASACGKDSNSDDKDDLKLGTLGYVVVDGSPQSSSNSIEGTGKVAFNDPIAEDGKHFVLGFTLQDGGSVTLTSFADAQLAGGLSIQLSRAATTLSASFVGTDGNAVGTTVLAGIDAAQAVALAIDVHNDEAPAHVVIWKQAADLDEPLFNSEDDTAAPGNGTGRIWGLTLANASVSSAELAEPKAED